MVTRPRADRVAIVLSAVPIAVLANVARITATGVVSQTLGEEWAHVVFHDFAGLLMMPLALVLLWLELRLLDVVLKEPELAHPLPLNLRGAV
jgi:exosortase/archaeosortase family protein